MAMELTRSYRCYRQPRISSFSEWSSVLRLATEWSFDAIRALAIDKLEVIATPVEKINLCHAFDIPQWLQGAYVALCTRPTSLLADEIRLLKAEDAELIMSVREDTLRSGLLAPRESDVSTRIAKLMAPHSEANSPPCPSNSPSPPSSESPPPLSETIISLLDKLQADVFYSVSDEIVKYVNSTNDEPDASTLREVIKAIWERAVTGIDAPEAELYAHLSRKLMQGLSPAVRDLSIVGRDGRPICGGHLFLKILLDRCQDEVEALLPAQGGNESLPTTATPSTLRRGHTVTMTRNHYSNFGRFIGELFKMQMLTERIMHACVKAPLTPLDGVNHPNEEQIAFLCSLLSTAGSILDAPKARAHFDVYFSRIQRMKTSVHATPYMVEMLEVSRSLVCENPPLMNRSDRISYRCARTSGRDESWDESGADVSCGCSMKLSLTAEPSPASHFVSLFK